MLPLVRADSPRAGLDVPSLPSQDTGDSNDEGNEKERDRVIVVDFDKQDVYVVQDAGPALSGDSDCRCANDLAWVHCAGCETLLCGDCDRWRYNIYDGSPECPACWV